MGIIKAMGFGKLREALYLAECGRLNAARSIWRDLPETFRCQVSRFTLFTFRQPWELDFVAHLTSPSGDFELSSRFVSLLQQQLPRITQ